MMDRIETFTKHILVEGNLFEVHYFTRFLGDYTDLYFFGSGLGEQALMTQMGDSFLTMVDNGEDPHLGRIMISMGVSETSYIPWKGDHNLYWGFGGTGDDPDWINTYMKKVAITPDLFLCTSKLMKKEVERFGCNAMYLPAGVNGRYFKPLGSARIGLGYTGLDSKPQYQKEAVLGPVLSRSDFEWIGRDPQGKFLLIEELNEWYNSKQIVFNMTSPRNLKWRMISNRMYEVYASGTPCITFRYPGVSEEFGFTVPYQTTNADVTVDYVKSILENYDDVVGMFHEYSCLILNNHNYFVRLETLFENLR